MAAEDHQEAPQRWDARKNGSSGRGRNRERTCGDFQEKNDVKD